MTTSESLLKKSELYNNTVFQASAKRNLFEVYFFNNLNKEALTELNEGMFLINKANQNDSLVILTKLNLFSSYANYYSSLNDYDNLLKYLRLFRNQASKVLNDEERHRLQYISDSHLEDFS